MVVFVCITSVGFGFSIQKLIRRDFVAPVRGLASVAEGADQMEPTSLRGGVVDLGCLERHRPSETLESETPSMRFRGRFCHLDARTLRNSEGIRIRNLTNDFTGTIFFQGYDASFVTDAMALKPGRNLIQFEWKDATSTWKTFTSEVIQR